MRKIMLRCLLGVAASLLLMFPVFGATAAHADTEDFSYDSWHVQYEVDKTSDGRAIAHVTETVSPRFPNFDQNRGVVRGLPIRYEGASTDPRNFAVTDGAGNPVPFEIDDEDGFRAVLVGDDSYVQGLQVYVISYTLSDVVLNRDDGTADEFYWDLMDFEHQQPVKEFSAEVSFTPELSSAVNGDTQCYAGLAKATSACTLSGAGTHADPFIVSPIALDPREGVTIAIGLNAGSVTQPSQRTPNFALDGLPLIIGGVSLATGAAGTVFVARTKGKRKTARGTIIPQYDVPSSLPPLIAGPLAGSATVSAEAQIVHLAVSGATRIEDGSDSPIVRIVDPERAADPLDQLTLTTLLPGGVAGDAVQIPKESEDFAKSMRELQASGVKAAVDRGYFERIRVPAARILGFVSLGVVAILAVLVAVGFGLRNPLIPTICVFVGIVVLILAVVSLSKHRVHTRSGAEMREYLEGVRMFIQVAEADRVRMLQSYTGAERRADGGVQVIHLYEKLLPYAILFGLEKEWSQVLEATYRAQPGYVPYWYPGVIAGGVSSLPSTLSQFTTNMSSSVSYTSSSSGGSSGGGFAGGGGGGGFSGGR
ncbi:MAG: DUF2207 domain-containing protein [Leucobacter sp.]